MKYSSPSLKALIVSQVNKTNNDKQQSKPTQFIIAKYDQYLWTRSTTYAGALSSQACKVFTSPTKASFFRVSILVQHE